LTYIGSISWTDWRTALNKAFDCTSIANYSQLTSADFFIDVTRVFTSATSTSGSSNITKSYNASTGILTISAPASGASGGGGFVANVYAKSV
jgi:hypothetical protein